MEGNEWIFIISAFVGAGGITALFRAKQEAPKLAAEAQSIVIQNLQADNMRLRDENTVLRGDLRVAELRIDELDKKYDSLEQEVRQYWQPRNNKPPP